MAGEIDAGQSAGWTFGSISGAHGKAKAPATGHLLVLLGSGVAHRGLHYRAILTNISNVAAKKFLSKAREIEIGALRICRSPVCHAHSRSI